MSAKDIYHDCVRRCLVKDGWTITHDPLALKWGARDLFVDLGAEQLFGAERQGQRIAVEVKSFVGPSEIDDLKTALGQFVLYHDILAHIEPERVLFLAIREAVFATLFDEPVGRILLENHRIRVVVFDPVQEVITQWTP